MAALLSRTFDDHPKVIATHAACMSAQHAAKIVVFVSIGWTFVAFTDEIVGMILATAFGTWLGKRAIVAAPTALLRFALKGTVTLLGLQIIGTAVAALI